MNQFEQIAMRLAALKTSHLPPSLQKHAERFFAAGFIEGCQHIGKQLVKDLQEGKIHVPGFTLTKDPETPSA